MIARIKGLKISQASERVAVTGQEMIPFQDGERNGKIRMIEFKDMTMYIFDPTIVDGKVSQEDYDALKQAIEEGKLIYTINSSRNGLDLATEVAIIGGTIYIESPDFIKEEGTDNISQVVFDTITVDGSLNYSKEQYTTTVIKTTGDGTKVLTDNGQYVYIGNLALTNIKFKDGTNTSTYDLVTNGITFRQNATPCVSWNTVKSGNNIYMDIRIANATASMDGLMSKEDYVELNTTIPGQIEDLKEADSNINNRIDDLDDKIDKEIADREAEIDRIENKFDGVTDKLEDALQKEIEDRKAGDTTITNSLNAFISTKGQPGGLAELDSTGKVPAAQLPSYVDDVLEFSTKDQFPQTGETGKIYVAKDTNLTLCSIPTVSFIMNDQKQIGTIAQNLEELGFEDIVTEGDTLKSEINNPEQFESFTKDGEEYVKVKKVEYEMLGVLAIEGVKMLKDEIEKLKAEIETLKNKQHE